MNHYTVNDLTFAVEMSVESDGISVVARKGGHECKGSFPKADLKDKDKCVLIAREIARPFLMRDGDDPVIDCVQEGIKNLSVALHKLK